MLEGFYKDLSIFGGFLLLCLTGPGKIRSVRCSALPRHKGGGFCRHTLHVTSSSLRLESEPYRPMKNRLQSL